MDKTKEEIFAEVDNKMRLLTLTKCVVSQRAIRMDITELLADLGFMEYQYYLDTKVTKTKEYLND